MLITSTNIHGTVKMSVQNMVYPSGWVSHNFVFTDADGKTTEVSVFSDSMMTLEKLPTRYIEPAKSDIPVGEATEVTP
jgi:hypothetical protein